MKKYGKSSGDLIKLKQSFFDQNKNKLEDAKKYASIYAQEIARKYCKICKATLPKPSFYKLGVGYVFCDVCCHLNGINEDTDHFCSKIYANDNGKDYARNYYEHDKDGYYKRVESIYTPKAEFLINSLIENGFNPQKIDLIDIGAGSGYFLAALLQMGLTNIQGYEIGEFQVTYGNTMLQKKLISVNLPGSLNTIIAKCDANIISLIGVMEHLQNPIEVLREIKSNSNIKYVFFCVPMFSFSVFIEKIFEDTVMPRHLTGGHTHLFTEKSLEYIEKEFGFTRVSEWWFGSDLMDLYRSFFVRLTDNNSVEMVDAWSRYFLDEIDTLQINLDKQHKSSQVHILWKIR
jgi:hypothetical protein